MFSFLKSERWQKFRQSGSLLTVLTVLGVGVGVGLGFGLKAIKPDWTPREVKYVGFVGELFLRTLTALVLPLIVSSLIDAIGSLDLSLSKKIGARALIYYLGTTAIAAVLGLILAVAVQPGNRTDFTPESTCGRPETNTIDTILDLVRNIFPNNLVGAAIEVSQTVVNNTNASIPLNDRDLSIVMVPGTNMLGLVVFAMVLGVTVGSMKSKGKPVLDFFKSMGDATMIIITKVVSFSPVGICSLIAGQLVALPDPAEVFANIAWYFGTVLVGLAIHGLIILPLLFFLLTRKSPLKFIMNMFPSLATAFGTASSSASLPVTLACLEDENKVDVRVSRFVIPIGATVNMNGTALYLPVGAIFIAQLCQRTLSLGELLSISLISIATSIGAAGIPQVGMVIMITVLASVGLPADYMGFIIPVDWLVERFRTMVNVLGDALGAGIVAHMSKSDLDKIPLDTPTNLDTDFPEDHIIENNLKENNDKNFV